MLGSEVEVLEKQGGSRRRGDTCLDGWVVGSPGLCAKVRDGRAHPGRFELGMGGAVGSQWQGMKLSAVVWAGAGPGLEKESMCIVYSQ